MVASPAVWRALTLAGLDQLVAASPAVWRALTLAGLDQLLPIYPSLSQALAARPAPRPETRHK